MKVYSWEGSRFFLEWSLTELLGARGSGAFAWGPLAAVCSPGPQKRVGSVASFLVAPAGPVPVRVPSRPLRYRSWLQTFQVSRGGGREARSATGRARWRPEGSRRLHPWDQVVRSRSPPPRCRGLRQAARALAEMTAVAAEARREGLEALLGAGADVDDEAVSEMIRRLRASLNAGP